MIITPLVTTDESMLPISFCLFIEDEGEGVMACTSPLDPPLLFAFERRLPFVERQFLSLRNIRK